ncbi:hypothetical protein [Lentzea sp. NPDC051838]|uniref:hypothetical protein n=1 Tax=Lentzea sp. NPDC051838 TaxID=3154849 RepID=UPI0034296530
MRWLIAVVVALFLVDSGVAFAHTTMQFTIAGDGGTGILAYASWTDDNLPVDETVQGAVEAYSADRRHVGPIPLRPSSIGRSFYTAELPPGLTGTWRVLVQASWPGPGASEQELVLGPTPSGFPVLQTPVPRPGGAPGDFDLLTTALGIGIGAVVLVAVVFVVGRRRLASHSETP